MKTPLFLEAKAREEELFRIVKKTLKYFKGYMNSCDEEDISNFVITELY